MTLSDIYWPVLLLFSAVSGYIVRWATSFSVSEYDDMVNRFRALNDRCLNSLREAADIVKQNEQDELKRLSWALSDANRMLDEARIDRDCYKDLWEQLSMDNNKKNTK